MGVVGIVTHNGLDVLGLNAGWVEILHYCSDGPWGAAGVLYDAYRIFPGRKARGVFRPTQTRQLPRAVDLKGRLISCQSY